MNAGGNARGASGASAPRRLRSHPQGTGRGAAAATPTGRHLTAAAVRSAAGRATWWRFPPTSKIPRNLLGSPLPGNPQRGGPPTGDVADGRATPVAGRRGDAPLPASAIGPTPPRPAARGAITVCAVPPPPTESATTPTRVPLPSARPLLPSLSSPSLRTCVPVLCGCCPPAPAGPRRYGPAHVVWSPRRQGGAPGTSGRPRDLSAMPLPVDFFFFFFAASACR